MAHPKIRRADLLFLYLFCEQKYVENSKNGITASKSSLCISVRSKYLEILFVFTSPIYVRVRFIQANRISVSFNVRKLNIAFCTVICALMKI